MKELFVEIIKSLKNIIITAFTEIILWIKTPK